MRVIALLAWYNEDCRILWRCIRSLEGVADHVVAVDGAYRLYPRGKPRSPQNQYDEIHYAAKEAGIGATIVTPEKVWKHNEVEKRSFMFEEGDKIAKADEDWFLIMDADDYVLSVGDFRKILERTSWDVAAVKLLDKKGSGVAFRKLFRAIPGIYVEGAHYVFKSGNRYLWGNTGHHKLEPCEDAQMLQIVHDPDARPEPRKDAKTEYYRVRDAEHAEYVPVRGGRKVWPA